MDLQKCNVCGKEFDFESEGLGCGEVVVCGPKCAKKSAGSHGNKYAIHNDDDDIVDSDAEPEDGVHIY